VAKAHFNHKDILKIQHDIFVRKKRTRDISRKVQQIKEELKAEIENFYSKFGFEILVVQNALAIPVNIPLGLAITEFIMETQMPTIAHHHDFFWERERFNSVVATDYLRAAFPPVHPSIQHVVINSLAGYDLGSFTGASWTLIPNIFDFKTLPPEADDYNSDFRKEIGLDEDSLLVLQPTRIVSRKGIETAAELVKRLDYPKSSLVITHEAGDEGQEYLIRIGDFANFIDVDLKMISDRIGLERGTDENGKKIYTLWDAYLNTDLVVYPSLYEGYGNAFVEAVYCKKPIVVNRYSIFVADIETKGFDVIAFDGYLTDNTVQKVKNLLKNPEQIAQSVEKNYMLGWRYLSYEMLEEKIEQLLINYYGT
jgi:glycosyltransferase involved in cell wall biosynthesis